ncbi:vitamin D3 receptor-like isoform X2 [Ruditapes philippinarum]|uniref:vitamin D3 receptor-like isoform X2 n=1 Tax=Ruditapes philippinarum TaxID=129788 RepID=UPI00295BC51C|nr:vitamin D3 receptor-like isoform X2 [Ruditapes philippinarum]
MNEDLSSVIEQALLFALPLPVPECAETCNLDSVKGAPGTVSFNNNNNNVTCRHSPLPGSYNNQKTGIAYTEVENNDSATCLAMETIDGLYSVPYINTDPFAEDKDRYTKKRRETLFDFGSFDLDNEEVKRNCASFCDVPYEVPSDIAETGESQKELVQKCVPSMLTTPEQTVCSLVLPDSSKSLNEAENPGSVAIKVKKKRKREKNPGPYPDPILPPCVICNEKASGFHYGANTCEACKGFFRRTLKKEESRLKCKCKPDMREEWKRGPVKNGCSSCRFRRCLKQGMSRNAIKIGRYTIKHKTENINQVKSAEAVDKMIDVAIANVPENSPSSTFDLCEHASVNSPSSTSGLDFNIGSLDDFENSNMVEKYVVSSSSQTDFCDLSPETKKAKTCKNELMSSEEMDSIVDRLTDAHTKADLFETRNVPIDVIRQKQTDYLENYNMRKQMFGDMTLSAEEFNEFYNITGIDLDGRIEHMTGVFDYLERKISKLVDFAKAIPGFKRLSLNDQANLIKASRVESSLFGGYKERSRQMDLDRRILTTPWGKEIHLDVLAKIHPIDPIISRHKQCQLLVDLKLTEKEDAIIRAIVIMFTDRCPLEEPHKVEQIQEKLIACLKYILNTRSCGGSVPLFYKIFSFLTNLRNFSEHDSKFRGTLIRDYPMLSTDRYHLLKEFMS